MVTSSTTASVTFSSIDARGEVSKHQCSKDSSSFVDCISPASSSGFAHGAHSFQVRAFDTSGNVGQITTFNWTVDTVAPTITLISTPTNPTVSTTATFAFSGSDVGSSVAGYQCAIDNGTFAECTSAKSYTGLALGAHTFFVKAFDAAGNFSSLTSYNWTINSSNGNDQTAPLVKTLSVKDLNIQATQLSISGSCETGLPVSLYQNETYLGQSNCTSGVFTLENVANLSSPWILKVKQIDAAGNVGESTLPIDGSLSAMANINADGFVSPIDGLVKNSDLTAVTLSIDSTRTTAQIQTELETKLATAKPGTRVVWPAGTYTNLAELKFFRRVNGTYLCPAGQSQKPIILEASTPGQVIFDGNIRFFLCGSYIVFRGFKFIGTASTPSTVINLGYSSYGACNFCAIRQIHIDGQNQTNVNSAHTYISVGYGINSRNNEVTHSRFEKKVGMGVMIKSEPDTDSVNTDTILRIRGNYFQRTFPGSGNGFEVFRFGDSSTSHLNGKVILEHNLIENTSSEIETVSLKSHKNIIRFNTFYQVKGAVTNRIGYTNTFEGNYFLGNNVSGVGALRLMGRDHLIVANHFEGLGVGTSDAVETLLFHNTDSNMKGSARTAEDQDQTGVCDYTNYCQLENPKLFGNYFIKNANYITTNGDTSTTSSSYNEDNDNLAQPVGVKMLYNIFNTDNGQVLKANTSKVNVTFNWSGFEKVENNWFKGSVGVNQLSNGFLSQQKLNVTSSTSLRFSLPDSASRAQITLQATKASELNLTSAQRSSLVSYGKNLYQVTFPLTSADVGQFAAPYTNDVAANVVATKVVTNAAPDIRNLVYPFDVSTGDGKVDSLIELQNWLNDNYKSGPVNIKIKPGKYTGSITWDFYPQDSTLKIGSLDPANPAIFDGCLDSCVLGEYNGSFMRLQAKTGQTPKNLTLENIIIKNYTNGIYALAADTVLFKNIQFRNLGSAFNKNITLRNGVRAYNGYGALIINDSINLTFENNIFENLYNDDRPFLMHGVYLQHTKNSVANNNLFRMISGDPLRFRNESTSIDLIGNTTELSGSSAISTFEEPGVECPSMDIRSTGNSLGMMFPYKKIYSQPGFDSAWANKGYLPEGLPLSDGFTLTVDPAKSPANCAYRNITDKWQVFTSTADKYIVDLTDERIIQSATSSATVVTADSMSFLRMLSGDSVRIQTNALFTGCNSSEDDTCDNKGTSTYLDDVDPVNSSSNYREFGLRFKVKTGGYSKRISLTGGEFNNEVLTIPSSSEVSWFTFTAPNNLLIKNQNQSTITLKSLDNELLIDELQLLPVPEVKSMPVISFSSPQSDSIIVSTQSNSVQVQGFCNIQGQVVRLTTAGVSATSTCAFGLWGTSLDLSTVPNGEILIYADFQDDQGRMAKQITLKLVKQP